MTRVTLVTGAAGFIGATLVHREVEAGAKVIAVDRLNPDRWDRLGELRGADAVDCHVLDLGAGDDLGPLARRADWVMHLAAGTNMRRGIDDPFGEVTEAVAQTAALLEALGENSRARLLFVSSSAVYGMLAAERPARETDGPLSPISTYGAGKLAAEGLISACAHLHGVQATVVRLGTVVGTTMDRGALPVFVNQVLSGAPRIQMLGDGRQARSFVTVDDVAAAIQHLMDTAAVEHEVVNVAAEGVTEIRRVAEIVREESGESVEIVPGDSAQGWRGDVPVVALSTDRLQARGWRPAPSDEAVRHTARELLRRGVQLRADEAGHV